MSENTTPNKRQRVSKGARSRPDPRNPLVLDTRDLGRAPGSMLELHRRFPAPAGLGLDIVWIPQGAPLVLDLRMESVTEGVLVTGTVTAPITGECGRCLDEIAADFSAEFVELYAYPDSATDETADQDEVHRIEDDLIDLEAVVRDTVVLGLPVSPLCRPDCAGLCPDCGRRLDDLPADHTHELIDPKWAALAALKVSDEQPETSSDDAGAGATAGTEKI
jgi:uncharacterized protein